MTVTWCLTILAFIIIFAELGGWTSVPTGSNPHALIGLFTTLLAFIQPIMAYFRPHPGTPKRYIFNWAHWFVGNAAHILGSKSDNSIRFFSKLNIFSNCFFFSYLHLFSCSFRQSCNPLFSYLAINHLFGDSLSSSRNTIGTI